MGSMPGTLDLLPLLGIFGKFDGSVDDVFGSAAGSLGVEIPE